jgi:hypothetical protein
MFALVGAALTAAAFFFPQHRVRTHDEKVTSELASRLTADVLSLLVERLKIRCDRPRYGQDRKTLRGFRATAAIQMLESVAVEKLPNRAVEHFVRFRAGVYALNAAMNEERTGQPVPAADYAAVYAWTLDAFRDLQQSLGQYISARPPEPEWQCPPDPPSFVWPESVSETAP